MAIEIYTDGSAKGNPGPGGYGAILHFQGKEKELSQGFRKTTNNRMELLAVIVALEALKTNKHPVTVYSDSKYVVDAIEKGWLFGWEKKGFKKKRMSIFGNVIYRYIRNSDLNIYGLKAMLVTKKMSAAIN